MRGRTPTDALSLGVSSSKEKETVMKVHTILSKLRSASTATKAVIVVAVVGSSVAACALVGEGSGSSEAEFRQATTKMPEAKWLNR